MASTASRRKSTKPPAAPGQTTAKSWFGVWLLAHKRLCPHHAWSQYGDATDPFFGGWIKKFDEHRITIGLADRASLELQAAPPGWPEYHLAAVLAACQRLREADSRQAAQDELGRLGQARAEDKRRVERREEAWAALSDDERAAWTAEAMRRNPAARHIENLCRLTAKMLAAGEWEDQ
jgi:hypothetical protein